LGVEIVYQACYNQSDSFDGTIIAQRMCTVGVIYLVYKSLAFILKFGSETVVSLALWPVIENFRSGIGPSAIVGAIPLFFFAILQNAFWGVARLLSIFKIRHDAMVQNFVGRRNYRSEISL